MIHRMQRIRIVHILVMTVLVISTVMLCSAHTFADTSGNVTLSVGQSFNVMGTTEAGFSNSRDYQLTANAASNPMPGGTSGGAYTFTLSGDAEHIFTTSGDGGKVNEPALYFSHAGVYEYTVKPLTAAPNARYSYEDTTYTVRIYVENNPLKSGDLIVKKIVCDNNQGEKPDYIRYHCSYKGEAATNDDEEEDEDSDKGTAARTGDTSNLVMWSVILALVTAMLIFLLVKRHREDKENR